MEAEQMGRIKFKREWIWPLGIALGLAIVIAVNAAFIYLAFSGADEVVPSYNTEAR